MGVARRLGRVFLGKAVSGRTEFGGAMVRGLVSCAILGATILSFNLVVAAPSGASLSGWLNLNGQIEKSGGTFGWADTGTGSQSGCPSGAQAGAVNLAGTGGLFDCGSPDGSFNPNPALATTSATAVTGTAEGDIIPGSQTFIPDPANTETTQGCGSGGDQTGFVGGTKFGDNSGSYGLTQGKVTPSKDDMSDAYLVARTEGTSDPSPGNKELYFGAERIDTNGDTTVDIEFTQQTSFVSGTCASSTLNIPRTQGDFAIEFDWVNGGTVPSPVLFVWDCGKSPGTPCGAGNGQYVSASFPAGAIQLAENTAGTIPCGGWICRDTGGATTSVPQFGFIEGGIDLNLAGVGATCASTVVIDDHSAGTNGGPADQHDLVGPARFSTCPVPPMSTQQSLNPNGGEGSIAIGGGTWHDVATLQGDSTDGPPTGTVSFYECPATSVATQCTPSTGTKLGSDVGLTTGQPTTDDSSATSIDVPAPTAVGFYCFASVYNPATSPPALYSSASDNTPADPVDKNECVNVGPANPTFTTKIAPPSGASSEPAAPVGGAWGDSATVTGNTVGGAPNGQVDFYLCTTTSVTAQCGTTGATHLATVTTPDQTNPPASIFTLPSADDPTPTIGFYCFVAVYTAAEGGNYASVSQQNDTECFHVTPAASSTSTQQSTSSTGSGSVTIGATGTITDTVTVSNLGNTTAGTPGGSVTFYECGAMPGFAQCDTSNQVGAVKQLDSSGQATSDVIAAPMAVGTYCFGAVYTPGPNSNFSGSTDNIIGGSTGTTVAQNECFVVGQATPTLSTTIVPPSGATDTPSAPVAGAWGDSATVTGVTNGGAPDGQVDFSLCTTSSVSAQCMGGTHLATVKTHAVDGLASTFTLPSADDPTPTVGFYCFVAVYTAADGGNYKSVSQQQDTECFQVTPAPSSTTTQQSTSSTGSGSINIGGTITDTATVSNLGNPVGGAPTGSVTFTVCGPTTSAAACSDGTAVGTEPVALTTGSGGSSTAISPGFTPTAVGTYCFAAVYNPDSTSNYQTSKDNLSGDVQTSECFLVTKPDFKVVKTDVPGNGNPVQPGATIPYTVTVSNIGDGSGTATVTDVIPSNLTIVSPPPVCSVSGCVVTNTTGSTWTFTMALAAAGQSGDSGTVTFSAQVAASDTADVVNTATITSGPCDNGQAPTTTTNADAQAHAAVNNCSSTVTNPVPDFTVTKTDGPGANTPVAAGSTIPYTVAIKNVSATSGSAVITDTLPSQLTLASSPAPACTATAPDTCTVGGSGSTLTFTVSLAGGNTATATFSAVVAAAATGTITNTATITTGPCNTSAGCSSSVSNPLVVTLTATPTTAPPPAPVIAFTGADIAAMVASALALLGLGGFLVLISRRRRREGHIG